MRTLVIGYGVVGRGIHDYVREKGYEGYTFAHATAKDGGDFMRVCLPRDVKRCLSFDRIIIASYASPIKRLLSEYGGHVTYISSKAVYEGTDYGNAHLQRERMCFAASRHLASLTIWRLSYAFGKGERKGRLLARITEGRAVASEQVVEPLPASEVAAVVVGDLAGPSMTVAEVIEAMKQHKGE